MSAIFNIDPISNFIDRKKVGDCPALHQQPTLNVHLHETASNSLMMAKRPVDEVVDGNDAYLKRQKLTHSVEKQSSTPIEEIRSGKQLQRILAFDQNAARSRHG
jgi:hypothetical protein